MLGKALLHLGRHGWSGSIPCLTLTGGLVVKTTCTAFFAWNSMLVD